MSTRLSALQTRVLEVLSGIEPAWTLTGGAALAGFHLGHRSTRDLDLFWHGQQSIVDRRREVVALLVAEGLEVTELRSTPGFCTIQARNATETVLVDLVAEPVPAVERPELLAIGGARIYVDTKHER